MGGRGEGGGISVLFAAIPGTLWSWADGSSSL